MTHHFVKWCHLSGSTKTAHFGARSPLDSVGELGDTSGQADSGFRVRFLLIDVGYLASSAVLFHVQIDICDASLYLLMAFLIATDCGYFQ